VSGDTNGLHDIFIKDRQTGSVVRANTSSSAAQMTTGTFLSGPAISDNGRFVAFEVRGANLVTGYTGSYTDLYVKDMQTGAIEVDSVSTGGSYGNGDTSSFAISADGRYVTFKSAASNLVSGDTNGYDDVFVRDRALATTALVSKSYTGGVSNGVSGPPTISCDGAYVAFASTASNLISNDTNAKTDIFLVDRVAGITTDVTINGDATSGAFSNRPQLSCDGSTLIFSSSATNLVTGDTNGRTDIFAYDLYGGAFERVDVSSSGAQATGDDGLTRNSTRSVGYDGNLVVFDMYDAGGLVSGDTNSQEDVFLRNRKAGTTEIVSKRSSSTQTTADSQYEAISDDGKYIVYTSDDSGLVSGDTNGTTDVFVSKTGI
jgi:Tol biopolymer transport system component